ncbi:MULTISPECIES: DUF6088 family protein [Pirellulaceae]
MQLIFTLPSVRKTYTFFSDGIRQVMTIFRDEIQNLIHARGRGNVFTSKDFLDTCKWDVTDEALLRPMINGEIGRLGRGHYHYPRLNERRYLSLRPELDEIEKALAGEPA